MLEIVQVAPGSIASRKGIRPGDRLVSMNGHPVLDAIDVQFYAADGRLSLTVLRKDGTRKTLTLLKEPGTQLGIEYAPLDIMRCRNRCIFCFVDQMPAGCRRSLYVRDDDYRASFLFGNYITLGNLNEADWDRIFEQRLSPLYVSVHATDPALRSFLLRNKTAPPILPQLERLAQGGIRLHTQIVLCPGVNDGVHLEKTIRDLAGLFPAVMSIAAVPVGLTAHRKGLYPLKPFSRKQARSVVEAVQALGRQFRRTLGTRLVFASDEFYIRAGLPVPPARQYEDFPQIENGVGMVAAFLQEAARLRLPVQAQPRVFTVVTGESFGPILRAVVKRLSPRGRGPIIRVVTAKNSFFGPRVTVAGLLTGADILKAVKGRRLGAVLVIPAGSLKDDEEIFLDGMSRSELERKLGVSVVPAGGVRELLDIVRSAGSAEKGRAV